MQPHGVYRGAPTCQTGQTGQTQASRPRNTHTAAAIKQAKHYPCGTSSPEPNHTAACNPTGYIVTHQLVRQVRQVRQVRHKRHAPATCTPPQPSSCLAPVCLPQRSPERGEATSQPLLSFFLLSFFFTWKKKRRRSRSVRRCSQRLCRRVRSRWRGWSRRDVPLPI